MTWTTCVVRLQLSTTWSIWPPETPSWQSSMNAEISQELDEGMLPLIFRERERIIQLSFLNSMWWFYANWRWENRLIESWALVVIWRYKEKETASRLHTFFFIIFGLIELRSTPFLCNIPEKPHSIVLLNSIFLEWCPFGQTSKNMPLPALFWRTWLVLKQGCCFLPWNIGFVPSGDVVKNEKEEVRSVWGTVLGGTRGVQGDPCMQFFTMHLSTQASDWSKWLLLFGKEAESLLFIFLGQVHICGGDGRQREALSLGFNALGVNYCCAESQEPGVHLILCSRTKRKQKNSANKQKNRITHFSCKTLSSAKMLSLMDQKM